MKSIAVIIGLLLGIVVVVAVYIPFMQKKCPFCQKKNPRKVPRCRHCFTKLPEE